MDCTTSSLSYSDTGFFSKIVLDYINGAQDIRPFYKHAVSLEGMKVSIQERRKMNTDRQLLYSVLKKQYEGIQVTSAVDINIDALLNENTFTICTAHQPNIFTGPLYFIYKILHTIKVASWLNAQIPGCYFVPVYYMGSEDADLDELGHIFIDGERYTWDTKQTGAVGRMKVDKQLIKLLDIVSGQLLVQPFGEEILSIMRSCYTEGQTIDQATFQLVNKLHGEHGLLVLLPDNKDLKNSFSPVIEKELIESFSHSIVAETVAQFPADYKVQASGREVNMFFLTGGRRDRIEHNNGEWSVVNTDLKFNRQEILDELKAHPEHFSPNVILRPVLQEFILPNIAFIGGGGEIAYWLQLKNVFETVGVPYPMLILRNSFMYSTKEISRLEENLGVDTVEIFKSAVTLLNQFVLKNTKKQLNLDAEIAQLTSLYESIKNISGEVESTLQIHTSVLEKAAIKKLKELEKKILRAEKRKFEAESRQLQKIKSNLFPNDNLQERVENMMPYYAKWGSDFLKIIYENSPVLQQEFTVLREK